jgi:hypothetical protein
MRTKTLLLTAALTAAGVATSMAQVYSVNMVGYINSSIPSGYSIIANHLNNTPDNLVVNLFPAPPDTTTFYKYNAALSSYDILQYLDGAYEGITDMTLGPGEATFIASPSAFTHTFVGEVQLASSKTINAGYQMISSALPQSLPVEGAPNDGVPAAPVGLGYPVANGDTVYRYDNINNQYLIDQYLDGAWEGASGGSAPTPAIGEGFFLSRETGTPSSNWTRNFVVGVD